MGRETDSLAARLESDKQRIMSTCPGWLVWWLHTSDTRVTWHARERGTVVTMPLTENSPDDLIAAIKRLPS
jgi:hypothetical protein